MKRALERVGAWRALRSAKEGRQRQVLEDAEVNRAGVFGNPRLGTPNFIKQPTLAIDLPLKALVWEDANGRASVSYNSAQYVRTMYERHGAPSNPEATTRLEGVLAAATDAAVK